MRVRFRGDASAYDRARASGRAYVHARGELRRSLDGGVRIGTYPDGLVYVEGRAAAIVNGPDDHDLTPLASLAAVADAARDLAGAHDAPVEAIGRADLSSELLFSDPDDGLDLLTGAAALDVPWLKLGTEGSKGGRIETVYGRAVTGRSIVFRLYDKGVETGHAPPGVWVRLERQRRYPKGRERTVGQLLDLGGHEAFVGRELRALVQGDDDVTVCDRAGATELLNRRVAEGTFSATGAERLLGYLAMTEPARRRLGRATRYRREAALRALGIAYDPLASERRVVPIGGYLRRYAEAWAA